MMIRFYIGVLFFLCFAVGGCTITLDAVRVSDNQDGEFYGAPYTLNFTTFDITIKRSLVQCGKDVKIAASASATPSLQPDPQRHYRIDLESLSSFFKKTNLKVTYHDDGSLSGVNASVEDKTAEFVAGVLKGTASIALTAAGVDKGRGPAAIDDAVSCSTEAVRELASLNDLKGSVSRLESQLKQKIKALEALTDQAAVLGKHIGKGQANAATQAMQELVDARSDLADAENELKAALDFLTVTDVIRWPGDGETFKAQALLQPLTLENKKVQKWFVVDEGNLGNVNTELAATQVDAYLISSDARARVDAVGDAVSDRNTKKGLKYRIPVAGRLCLLVSKQLGDDKKRDACERSDKDIVLSKIITASQLGPIHVLPLKSYMFSNKTISASFTKEGLPTEIELSSEASSDKAATLLKDSADIYTDYMDKYEQHKESESEEALNEIKAKTELLTAQKDYEKALAALNPPVKTDGEEQVEILQAETTLLNAQVANLQAARALWEAQQLGQ